MKNTIEINDRRSYSVKDKDIHLLSCMSENKKCLDLLNAHILVSTQQFLHCIVN